MSRVLMQQPVHDAIINVSSLRRATPIEIIGKSPALQQIQKLIDRIAQTDHHLLVCGPTGSGKEVIARSAHANSQRNDAPFVDVNCGAIPENLFESELFGHVKGAFTGATEHRSGFFQEVGNGTLFLDEIGELPLSLQPKLLRVLETRSFKPVGSSKSLPFHGRVIAATHRDLLSMVKEGLFREDLYYRLSVFVFHLPSLDQRKEDIPALVTYFAARQPKQLFFSEDALFMLAQQNWPGNIRQLRNLIDRIGVLTDDPHIDVTQLAYYLEPLLTPLPKSDSSKSHPDLIESLLNLASGDKLSFVQDMLIDYTLERHKGNKSAAANFLGIGRKSIEHRLKVREQGNLRAKILLDRGRRHVDAAEFREAALVLRSCLDEHIQLLNDLQKFEAYRLLGTSLRSTNGWLCSEAQECYETAFRIGSSCCDALELSTLQFGIWVTQLMKLELSKARGTAQDMMIRAQNIANQESLDEAHVALANTLFWLGDYEETIACMSRSGLLDPTHTGARIGIQGFDLTGMALTFNGLAAFQHGDFDVARHAMEMLRIRSFNPDSHAFNKAMTLQGAGWLACLFEEIDKMGELGSMLESLSQANNFVFYQGVGQIVRGCHIGLKGQCSEAVQIIKQGFQDYMVRNGGLLFHSFQAWHQGEMLLRAGEIETCYTMIEHAIDIALEQQDRAYLGELFVIRARAQWALGKIDIAEQELRNAMSTALALGSVPARISAAYHLARLMQETQRPAQALDTLNRGLRGTNHLKSCPVLQRAQDLLGELQPS